MRRFALLALTACAVTGMLGASASAATIPGEYIVVLKDSVEQPGEVAHAHGRKYGVSDRTHVYRHALKGYAASIPEGQLRAVRADSRVAFVTPDREVSQAAQTLPRGIDRIDADTSSTAAGNGSGAANVNVAVLDTGIDGSHPDLNVVGSTSCLPPNQDKPDAPGGHGTHVAGTIGALDNDFGVVGVAPGARLFSVRVIQPKDTGKGSISTVICGIDWATATRTDADPTNDIAVVNMSLGFSGSDSGDCSPQAEDALHIAICRSTEAGVTHVASAGNEAADFQHKVPAAYDEVLTVTAMSDFDGTSGGLAGTTNDCNYRTLQKYPDRDADDRATSFSNFATLASDAGHTVAAPGLCVLSTFPVEGAREKPFQITSPGYAQWQGTSMAAPHAAGTVALCIAAGDCAGLTPSQIVQKMVSDAAAYSTANSSYGFQGDPLRPITDKYYGYLIRAGLY